MHRLQAILNASESTVNTATSLTIVRNRTEGDGNESYPVLGLQMGDEEETDRTSTYQIMAVDIEFEIIVSADQSKDLDAEFLKHRTAIHKAMMIPKKLGLSFVESVTPMGQRKPKSTNVGDRPTAFLIVPFRVEYYSPLNNPEV
jgi:hypothetical protein